MQRLISALALACLMGNGTWASAATDAGSPAMDTVQHLGEFQVIEFRRYHTSPGERDHFTAYFDSLFPEAMEQLGALVLGSFHERGSPTAFAWLRGFHTLSDRPIVNSAFYYGPVWKEHRTAVNAILPDSDNVMLLQPVPGRGVMVLPAVDPVGEPDGAKGVLVAEIFSVKKGGVDGFIRQAEPLFARYRAAGVREMGVLETLDVPNNFPQLPIREDGPFVVWMGMVKDDPALKARFEPLRAGSVDAFTGTGLLRSAPEIVIMDPTRRSRLRWFPSWQ
ncbi:MAG TPA: hypothetical protein VLV87_01515 [Gammaproteobacteria bacterium]|nr:hypothetical protein [Gammaproteobacteria bacterium]